MIQNIEISRIYPHYDNPRKDLGDLTELTESIKSNGILQNLTVVPWFSKITGVGADDPKQQEEMGYIVVIGHRRLAAAKLAGLTEVPCSISNMSIRKQISTMLLENMQRSDLTIYEQAQGFQMMLDFGETVGDIAKQTGFSYSTISRRVKLLEFNKEKFRQSVERGGTLMDYTELEKIEDLDLRNKVLDKIGTSNFKWELQAAVDKEKSEKNKALIIAELEKFATQVESTSGLRYVESYSLSQKTKVTAPEDVDTVEYFFQANEHSSYITLYKKSDNTNLVPNSPEWLEKQRERDERRAALEEISKQAYQLRCIFIKEISNARAKKNMNAIIEYLLRAMLTDDYCNFFDLEEFANFLDIEINEEDEYDFGIIADHVTAQPELHLLIAAYLMLDSAQEKYYDWNNQFNNNETLNKVYDFLVRLGYEMSEDELSLQNGTHNLFLNTI